MMKDNILMWRYKIIKAQKRYKITTGYRMLPFGFNSFHFLFTGILFSSHQYMLLADIWGDFVGRQNWAIFA